MNFCPEKLVETHLRTSKKKKKLWNGVQDLMNLKIINLRFSIKLKELPDFSNACNLEIVDLACCWNLPSIHPSILSLPKLVYLNLSNCGKLKNLHGENHLKSLKHLKLSYCRRLKEFLLSLEEMRSLDLSATGIKTLNLSVGRFNKLEDLTLGRPLESFQINELSCLKSLKKFSLSHFRGVLEKSKLHILFDVWPPLEELHLTHCEVLEIPENISGRSLLKILSLRRCNIESLPHSIKHLSELKQIDLGKCRITRDSSTNGIKARDGYRNIDARIIQRHRDARINQRYSKIEELELDAQLFEKRLRENCGNELLPSASSTSSRRSKLVGFNLQASLLKAASEDCVNSCSRVMGISEFYGSSESGNL
ncbi:hypothetical protein K1719_009205 [Acacia pycnantha]|nr:hypothetical protein K1719_009205 [Acacia pycnantha]